LSSLGEEAKKVALSRRTEVAALAKCLHKELEWIPLKAMRKERSERYRSASEFVDDIDNYLKGAPLLAGPLSTAYRLKKFVRRNRALVSGIAAVLAVLLAGVVVSTLFAIRADRALTEAQTIADFLRNDVLASAYEAKAGEATVSYILDAASKSLEDKFKERPLIEASVCETLGETYDMLGESAKAEQQWLRALQIYQHHRGEDHPATIRAMKGLYWVYDHQERHFDAEHLGNEILSKELRIHGGEYLGNLWALAHTYHHLGKYEQAESSYDKVLEPVRREHGADYVHFSPMQACNLARVYAAQGRYEEAEQLFRKTLETTDQDWGTESRWRLRYTADLANMYRDQGRHEEAGMLLVKTLKTQRQLLGDKHVQTLESMCNLARVYTAQARYPDAEDLLNEGIELACHQLREGHPETLRFVNALAVLRAKQENEVEAESFFKEALKGRQRELGPVHPETLETKNGLAVLYKEQARYHEAEPLLIEALEGRRLKLGYEHPHTIESLNNLIALYEAWDKPEKAEEWREYLRIVD